MDEASITAKFQKVVDLVSTDIGSIRTGRATPSLVENIVVPAYGGTQNMKILEVASITTPDPTTLVISPWDKSIIGDIKKGILEANVGLNPNIDGEIIRITVATLTTEDREKYVKLLSQKIESGKVMIRQVRGEQMQSIRKSFEDKDITEDEKFAQEKSLQEMVDKFVKVLEEKGETKKTELLQI